MRQQSHQTRWCCFPMALRVARLQRASALNTAAMDILLPDYAQQLAAQLRSVRSPSTPLAAAIATWKQSIIREQIQLLHLCEWKIWLTEARDLLPALKLVQHSLR